MPARPRGTPCRTADRNDSPVIPSLWHATSLEASESFPEVAGSRHSPDSPPCGVDLELRLLPSAGVTRLPRYYEPLRHPTRPGLSLAGVRSEVATLRRVGLPVFRHVPLPACRRQYPGGFVGAIAHHPQRLRPSPSESWVGSRVGFFGACSAFTRVTACMLAGSPCGDPFHRRLRRARRLPRRFDCFRPERQLPGGTFTRWVRASFHGALSNGAYATRPRRRDWAGPRGSGVRIPSRLRGSAGDP